MDWKYPKELVPFSSVGVNPIKSIGVTYVECFACVHRFFRLGQCFLISCLFLFLSFFCCCCCCCCCFWVSLRSWTRGIGKIKHAHVPIFRVICDLSPPKNHRSITVHDCVLKATPQEMALNDRVFSRYMGLMCLSESYKIYRSLGFLEVTGSGHFKFERLFF